VLETRCSNQKDGKRGVFKCNLENLKVLEELYIWDFGGLRGNSLIIVKPLLSVLPDNIIQFAQ
jgi:hypothetical protein